MCICTYIFCRSSLNTWIFRIPYVWYMVSLPPSNLSHIFLPSFTISVSTVREDKWQCTEKIWLRETIHFITIELLNIISFHFSLPYFILVCALTVSFYLLLSLLFSSFFPKYATIQILLYLTLSDRHKLVVKSLLFYYREC